MKLLDIFKNDVLMVSFSAWLIAQLIKIIVNAIINKTFSLERLFGDGGMPSGHSATVTAAALMIGLHQGFASPLFGLAFIVAIIVMHDACGVRYETGKHANSINNILFLRLYGCKTALSFYYLYKSVFLVLHLCSYKQKIIDNL